MSLLAVCLYSSHSPLRNTLYLDLSSGPANRVLYHFSIKRWNHYWSSFFMELQTNELRAEINMVWRYTDIDFWGKGFVVVWSSHTLAISSCMELYKMVHQNRHQEHRCSFGVVFLVQKITDCYAATPHWHVLDTAPDTVMQRIDSLWKWDDQAKM